MRTAEPRVRAGWGEWQRWVGRPAIGATGFLIAWLFFYIVGQIMISLTPSSGLGR